MTSTPTARGIPHPKVGDATSKRAQCYRFAIRRRQEAQLQPVAVDREPLIPEVALAMADAEPCGPDDVTLAPTPATPAAALKACGDLAVLDAANCGADRFTGPAKPRQPSAGMIAVSAKTPTDRLGERWFRAKYLYETGVLGKVAPNPVTSRLVLRKTAPLILVFIFLCGAGIINELIYGKKATSLLTSASDEIAATAAVSISLLFSATGFVIAHLTYNRRRDIVHKHGAMIAFALVVGIILIVLGLGAVVAGFDAIAAIGLDGGSAASRTDTGADRRMLLGATYAGLFIITTLAIAAGHLLLAHEADEVRIRATIKAQDEADEASLDNGEQTSLMIEITNAHIDAIPAAQHEGGRRVAAYNATWFRSADAETNEIFEELVYQEEEPAWKQEAVSYRNHLTDVHNVHAPKQRPHLHLA